MNKTLILIGLLSCSTAAMAATPAPYAGGHINVYNATVSALKVSSVVRFQDMGFDGHKGTSAIQYVYTTNKKFPCGSFILNGHDVTFAQDGNNTTKGYIYVTGVPANCAVQHTTTNSNNPTVNITC